LVLKHEVYRKNLKYINPTSFHYKAGILLTVREQKTVLQNLRLIIGLARSNPQHEAAFMHASHILSACMHFQLFEISWILITFLGGTYFSEREEQDAVIEFLNDIHTRGIWKTYSIVTRLQEQWNEHR
jgi:cytochrome b561